MPRRSMLALLAALTVAHAGYSFDAPPAHPDWEPGIEAIQRADWAEAIERLAQVVRNEPGNADAHAMLGFAHQRNGDIGAAIWHYDAALRFAPDHRFAHRNLGEARLSRGERSKAEVHLARLLRSCGADCDEYRTLRAALDRAKR